MKNILLAAASFALAACASTDHRVDHNDNLLQAPRQNETPGEQLQRAQQDGCLSAGGGFGRSCRREREAWADLLGPPELPEGVEISLPPPLPEAPDDD